MQMRQVRLLCGLLLAVPLSGLAIVLDALAAGMALLAATVARSASFIIATALGDDHV